LYAASLQGACNGGVGRVAPLRLAFARGAPTRAPRARKRRSQYPGAFYRATNRGDRREEIFVDHPMSGLKADHSKVPPTLSPSAGERENLRQRIAQLRAALGIIQLQTRPP
jgi:hypothetical protein